MLLTAEEAKNKWCPMARQIGNRDAPVAPHNRSAANWECCVGAACMAWRWGLFGDDGTGQNGPKDYTSAQKCVWAPIPLKGYCGAFGKVEGIA